MGQQSITHPVRAVALLCLVTCATWVLLGQMRSIRHPTSATFDALLTAAAGWALLAALGWALLICAAAVLETLTSGRLGAIAWVCPQRGRQILLPALGIALATGVITPVRAAAGPSVPPGTADAAAAAGSLPVPARPVDAERPTAVVRPRDTLWGLAAERMGASAADSDIARVVARTHRLNRPVIGPDPDLIRPGQRLTLPHIQAHIQAHTQEKQ